MSVSASSAAAQWYNVLAATEELERADRISDLKQFANYAMAVQFSNIKEVKQVLQRNGITVKQTSLQIPHDLDCTTLQQEMQELSNKHWR